MPVWKTQNKRVAAVSAFNAPGSRAPSARWTGFLVVLRQTRLVFRIGDFERKRLTTIDAFVVGLHERGDSALAD